MINKITFKGLKAAVTQVSYAFLSMLFTAWTAIKSGKPEKARSITYYICHSSRNKALCTLAQPAYTINVNL